MLYTAAAAAKSLSRVQLCATPQTAAHQAPRPRDSPGKNTGVGCHFLLQCMKVKSESEVAQSCPTLSDPMDCSPPGAPIPGILQARMLERAATGALGLYNFITGKTKGKPSKTVTVQREKIYCHQRALSCPFCVPCSNLY